jgi:hypothetical protein
MYQRVSQIRSALSSCKRKQRRILSGPLIMLGIAALLLQGLVNGVSPTRSHAATLNAIQTENQLTGDPTWDNFASVGQQDAISGYASPISVNHGQPIDFYITTTASSFTIKVYRMGWYGGAGARLMSSMGTFTGVHQAIPSPDPVTGMVSCDGKWQKTTTLNVPSTWVTGVYLARLDASNGDSSYIFFVVRNDGGTEAIDFQTSVTTYQAYNAWGGVSLYTNNGSSYKYAHATKVSFDRPFDPLDSNGAGHLLYAEYPFIRWAEENGYDLTYTTDVDTHTNINPLTNHKALLSVGHDEYWSKPMRDNVQNAINSGVNVGFFGANDMYWQIRFEPNADGLANRVEVGYKDTAIFTAAPGPDPMYGVNNAVVTTNWRDTPVNLPENAVIGVMYDGQVPTNNYAYVVQNASNWVYAGTGFTNGSSVPGIVGYEYDKTWSNGYTPPGLTVLSNSPVCCSDTQWDNSKNTYAQSSIYTAPSGARVFAAGTIDWAYGLDNYSSGNTVNAGIQQTTANILNNFISGSAPPAPAVTLSPPSLAFGNQPVSSTSAAQSVTVTNSGTAALTISSITLAGTNPGDYAQTNTCPTGSTTLAAGSSCTISVTFAPTATGSRTASISIADSASGSPHTVSLSGTGTAPGVTLNPTSLTFGNQPQSTTSAAQSVTLTNTGTAPLTISSISVGGANPADFAQTTTCPISPSTLAAGAKCTINVTFTPSTISSESANLSVSDTAGDSPQSVALSGTGTAPAPVVSLAPTSLSFSSQVVNTTSAAQNVTLTNSGNADLTISSIGLTGTNPGDFTQTTTCPASPSTLTAGSSCTISVTFTPTATGTRSASVAITDNASGSPQSVALTGTGASAPAPAVTLNPTNLTFSSQLVNTTSAAQSVTLTNSGTAALTISSIGLTGTNASDFAQTNTCPASSSTLAAGAKCTISVTFTPTATGSRTASVSITDNASGSPHTVAVSGTGTTASSALFSDGFESGSLPGAWTSTKVSGTNSLALDSSFMHTGAASLKAVVTKGSTGTAYISKTITGQTSLDARGYYYLNSPVNFGAVQLMSLYAQKQFIGWVTYNVDPTTPTFTVYNGANNTLYTCSAVPSMNAWHSIELQYTLSTTTTGSFTLWLAGIQVCGKTGIKTSPQSGLTINQVVVGSDSADKTVGLTVHVDDVVLNSSYIGP